MKRLIYDIETSPNIGLFWQPGYKVNLSYENIIKERAIICICYKWEGQRGVDALTWDKNQCDKKMLVKFIKTLKEADEAVAHNGDKFDIKWIRGRAIFHRIPMPPDIITIDTCKLARQTAYFNANRLDYLAQFLGFKGKIHTEYDLWKDILLHKDAKAMAKMVRYCKRDVNVLEKVYRVMKPYIKARTSVTTERDKCPECGGDMVIQKTRVMASGAKKTQMQCVDCGKYNTVPTSKVK